MLAARAVIAGAPGDRPHEPRTQLCAYEHFPAGIPHGPALHCPLAHCSSNAHACPAVNACGQYAVPHSFGYAASRSTRGGETMRR